MSDHADTTPLAQELIEALDDPERGKWGGYPWEHLGDAEQDVRKLLDEIAALTARCDALENALRLVAKAALAATDTTRESGRPPKPFKPAWPTYTETGKLVLPAGEGQEK
jgi:hypothetical protein